MSITGYDFDKLREEGIYDVQFLEQLCVLSVRILIDYEEYRPTVDSYLCKYFLFT